MMFPLKIVCVSTLMVMVNCAPERMANKGQLIDGEMARPVHNCDDTPKDNPCIKCNCKQRTRRDQISFPCEEVTTQCHQRLPLPCVDSVTFEGDCCPTCPNGDNCKILGQVVKPSDEKYFNPENELEYYVCHPDGYVGRCVIKIKEDGTESIGCVL